MTLKMQQWKNFGERRAAMGMTPDRFYNEVIDGFFSSDDLEHLQQLERGETVNDYEDCPLDYMDYWSLCDLAEGLQCTLDYLFGRTTTPQPPTATLESTPVWRDPTKGELPADGEAVIVVRNFAGFLLDATDAVFRNGAFTETAYGLKFNDVVLWQPFDVSGYDVPDSGTNTESEDNHD